MMIQCRKGNEEVFSTFPVMLNNISDIIACRENMTPLTIGIYGSWITGKISLMSFIAHNLKNAERYNGRRWA